MPHREQIISLNPPSDQANLLFLCPKNVLELFLDARLAGPGGGEFASSFCVC